MKLHFNQWVSDYGGANKLAQELNVTGWAVRVWLRGEGAPLAETINTIIRLSKGSLTFEQIYKESTRSKK